MANKESLENVEMNEEVKTVKSETNDMAVDTEESKGLSKREKIILIVIAILLFLMFIGLLLFGLNRMTRGGLDAREPSNGQSILSTTPDSNSDGSDLDGEDANADNGIGSANDAVSNVGNNDNGGNNSDAGSNNSGSNGNAGNSGNNGNSSNNGGTGNSGGNGTSSNPGQNGNTSEKPDNQQPTTPPTGNADEDTDNNDNPSDDSDNNSKDDGQNNDAAPDYAGETKVRISKIDANTGVITLTVEGENIVVPVQTTVFNGRITKSGVAQGNLFGYNCGVTIMLFYPENEVFNQYEVNGYMSRNADGLTILVDINGNGSKLLIKVNGMKSLL